jgi:hypothetical protein
MIDFQIVVPITSNLVLSSLDPINLVPDQIILVCRQWIGQYVRRQKVKPTFLGLLKKLSFVQNGGYYLVFRFPI